MTPIRALFEAVKIPGAEPPYDTAHLKLYYPAVSEGTEQEKMTGMLPADKGLMPLPIVLFFNGINVGIESYHWLAVRLAERGMLVVMYSLVGPTLPGVMGLTPGIDLAAVRPDTYGSRPTCPAIAPILELLARLNDEPKSILYQSLALDAVVLGGHSAGGTVALQNGQFFDAVRGVFSYAGHTMASTMLGFAPRTILPVGTKPILLLYGDRDGVIDASSIRYGLAEHGQNPVQLTLEQGYSGDPADGFAVCIRGANHFSVAHPLDDTVGRSFLDHPDETENTRDLLFGLIDAFVQNVLKNTPETRRQMRAVLNPSLIFSHSTGD